MAELRLYRDILCTSVNSKGISNNVLITPSDISALTSGSTGVIENVTPIEDITGRFYVNLNADLYLTDTVYQLVWTVRYVPNSPLKQLITRFKLNPNVNINLGSDVYLEVLNNPIELYVTTV